MHVASQDLIKSLDGKDLARIKAAAMKLKNSCVQCHDAFLHVYDQNDDLGGFDRQLHLSQRGVDNDIERLFSAQ